MSIKYKDLGELKNMIRDNTMKVYESIEDYKNDTDKKNISYVISDTGWTKVSTLSIDGNRAVIVSHCNECPIVEHYESSISVDIRNKIPGSLLREIVETFARVCNGGAGASLRGAEAAAQIYKHSETGEYFIYYPTQTVSGASVTYADDPGMLENRNKHKLVFECHSHNSMGAFWSGTDDANEKEFGYYMVIGQLNRDKAQYKFRVKYENTYGDLEANQLFDITKDEEDNIFTKSTWGPGNPDIDTKAKTAAPTYSKCYGNYQKTGGSGDVSGYNWENYWDYEDYGYASSRGAYSRGRGYGGGRGRGRGRKIGSYSYLGTNNVSSSYYDSVSAFEEWLKENPDEIIVLESNPIYKDLNNIADWGENYCLEYEGWRRMYEMYKGKYQYMYKYIDNDKKCDPSESGVLDMIDIVTGSLSEDEVISSEDLMLVLTIDDYGTIEALFDCTEEEVINAFNSVKVIKVSKAIQLVKLVMCPDSYVITGNANNFCEWLKEV